MAYVEQSLDCLILSLTVYFWWTPISVLRVSKRLLYLSRNALTVTIAYYDDYAYCKQLLRGTVKYDNKFWNQDINRVLYGYRGIRRKLGSKKLVIGQKMASLTAQDLLVYMEALWSPDRKVTTATYVTALSSLRTKLITENSIVS